MPQRIPQGLARNSRADRALHRCMRTAHTLLATRLAASAIATLALAAACATEPSTAPPSSAPSVQALIGDARCSADTQCATIGVGAKACGGPDAYVAWSTT